MRGSSRCFGRVLAAGMTLAAATHLAFAAGDPLAALNDEFGGPATRAQWSRPYQTELAYKMVTGDFRVSTPVHISDLQSGALRGTRISGLPDFHADFDGLRFATSAVPAALAGADFSDSHEASDAALVTMPHVSPLPEPTTYWFLLIGIVLVLGWLALRQRIK